MADEHVLPADSEKLLAEIRDEWIGHGLSTERANRALAEEGVRMAYEAAHLPPPARIYWRDSPLSGALAAAILSVDGDPDAKNAREKYKITDEQVREHVWYAVYGQHDAGWLSFYDAMARLGVKEAERLNGVVQVAKNAGWWWPFTEAVVLTERPLSVVLEQGRLHNETEPAVLYPDDFKLYAWRGIRLPPTHWWIITNPEKLTADKINKETNIEFRRVMLEKLGAENYAQQAGIVEVQRDDYGTLYLTKAMAPDSPNEKMALVRVACPSTEREYWLRVPPDSSTAREAVAWTYDVPADEYEPTAQS